MCTSSPLTYSNWWCFSITVPISIFISVVLNCKVYSIKPSSSGVACVRTLLNDNAKTRPCCMAKIFQIYENNTTFIIKLDEKHVLGLFKGYRMILAVFGSTKTALPLYPLNVSVIAIMIVTVILHFVP